MTIFYGNKKRLRLLQTAGYLLCFLLFAVACYLNTGVNHIGANAFFVFALFIFFITYLISKRFSQGLLTVSDKEISFLIGFRTVELGWDNIESYEIFTFKGKKCLGIKIKSLDFAKGALLRILELNYSQISYHISFEQRALNEKLEDIAELIKKYHFVKEP